MNVYESLNFFLKTFVLVLRRIQTDFKLLISS